MIRRRRLGCVGSILFLVLLAGAVYVVLNGADYVLFAPWAYGFLGRPTLTGDWTGTITVHGGVPLSMYLQLERYRDSRGAPITSFGHADIDGHVSWCGRGMPNTTSTVYGFANHSASQVVLETGEVANPRPGPFPARFQGAWHGSRLVLRVSYDLVENRAYGNTQPPVRVTFHKKGYDAYRATCPGR